MKFDYSQSYAGSPEQVVALLRNPDFIAELARRADALDHAVEVVGDDVEVTLLLPAPDAVASFLGDSISVKQLFRFEPVASDGSIDGALTIEAPGTPVDARADIDLSPTAEGGTTALISGELDVRVPLIGRQLERQAEPLIAKGLVEIERTAADWLG